MNSFEATPCDWYSGRLMPSWLKFLVTIAGPWPKPQFSTACTPAVPLILVSWAVMSVSAAP